MLIIPKNEEIDNDQNIKKSIVSVIQELAKTILTPDGSIYVGKIHADTGV